jgi:hypothetical protein
MSGMTQCARHGRQPGMLCCDHVRNAVSHPAEHIPFDTYQVDIKDGTEPLEHMLCNACAERFGLSARQLISAEVWEDANRFPYVCPVCVSCFLESSNARTRNS